MVIATSAAVLTAVIVVAWMIPIDRSSVGGRPPYSGLPFELPSADKIDDAARSSVMSGE
jgi:hypothetical protein